MNRKKNIFILGATGSVGESCLDVIFENSNNFNLLGFSYYKNIDKAQKIAKKFNVKYIFGNTFCTTKKTKFYDDFSKLLKDLKSVDLFVNAISGFSGIKYTIDLINNNNTIALANKESLVIAGNLIQRMLKNSKSKLLPLDSEHSAIWQLLLNYKKNVKNIILTASGGNFLNYTLKNLTTVKYDDAFSHPNWKMGKEITINSSTMMNKAFEIIETKNMFNISLNRIQVIIHPNSIIHSMVELVDNSIISLMSVANMKLSISTALFFPQIKKVNIPKLDLNTIGMLKFVKIDYKRWDAVAMAYECADSELKPIVLTIANEYYVQEFIEKKICFWEIIPNVRNVFDTFKCKITKISSYNDIKYVVSEIIKFCKDQING